MNAWPAALVFNLALLAGIGWGYAWWGRRADALVRELTEARARAERFEREAAAARATGGASATSEQQWEVRGVIRAVLPEMSLVVITHEDIPGYMPSMTMAFRAVSPEIHESVRVGDSVRFTLRGHPPNVVVTAIRAARDSGGVRR